MKIKNTFILLLFGVAVLGIVPSKSLGISIYSVNATELWQSEGVIGLGIYAFHDSGMVVGGIEYSSPILGYRGFVYDNELKTIDARNSEMKQITQNGTAFGWNGTTSVTYKDGKWADFPNGSLGITSDGHRLKDDGLYDPNDNRISVFPETFFPLAISDDLVITGRIYNPLTGFVDHGIWKEGQVTTIVTGDKGGFIQNMSSLGSFVIGQTATDASGLGFRYDTRTGEFITLPHGPWNSALKGASVNENGYILANQTGELFVISPDLTVLPVSIENITITGTLLPYHINNNGDIIISTISNDPSVRTVYELQASIPEPAHFAAALGGLIVLLVVLRKRT